MGVGVVLEARLPSQIDIREALRLLNRQIIHVVADDLLTELTDLAWVIFLRLAQLVARRPWMNLSTTDPSLLRFDLCDYESLGRSIFGA